jgi:DNA-binding HxlR family transcriptional regulator
MRGYGEFCPIAKAAEVLAERWTPLIIRELMISTRFSEIEQGLPGIPKSLLVQRLRSLERAGVLVRETGANGRSAEYRLTQAGEEITDVIVRMGEWGQRWANDPIDPADLQPAQLVWYMRHSLNLDRLPERRVVVELEFRGHRKARYWLVLDREEPSVCLKHPGFDVDVFMTADTMALHQVWLGRLRFQDAARSGLIELEGPSDLVRAFPSWLRGSVFAHISPAPQAARSGSPEPVSARGPAGRVPARSRG